MDAVERRLRERLEALSASERVRVAAALGAAGEPGELVAVVRADGAPPGEEELRSHARARLPEYMVPRRFIFADTLPRTPAGKLDRQALSARVAALPPVPGARRGPETDNRPGGRPTTEAEKALADIWASVLGSDTVFVDDDFFELGGDSLLSIRVIARAKQAGYAIDPRQFFATPTIAALAAAAERAPDASELEERGPEAEAGRPADAGDASRNDTDGRATSALPSRGDRRAPLSFAQAGFWFLDRLDPGDPAYNVAVRIDLRGPLEGDRLGPAFREVLARHDALRATVRLDSGEPWLDALPPDRFTLERVDLAHLPNPEAGVLALSQETASHRFDLLGGPLVRGVLARLAPEHHALLLTFHHMVLDGESVRLVLEDLGATYRGSTGRGDRDAGNGMDAGDPTPASYRDYAVWERDRWSGEEVGAESLRYWTDTLADVPERIEWPPDDRPAVGRARSGATARRTLPLEVADAVGELCGSLGCTPFVLLLAVYQVFLHRHAGQRIVVVGTPVGHRPHPALERAVGYFQNMLPLRGELGDDPGFSDFVTRTREAVAGALAHADVPFERIVEAVVPHRDPTTTPLFQTAFTFRDGTRRDGWRSALGIPGVEVDAVILHNGAAKFELALEVERTEAGLTLVAEYAEDRFSADTVSTLLERFEVLLRSALGAPTRPISGLSVMSPDERQRTLGRWSVAPEAWTGSPHSDRPPEAAPDPSVPEQVEAVARTAPGRAAVTDAGGSLTFGELAAGATKLAEVLRSHGVEDEALVAVMLPPSREQVMWLLATWKAGGAFLALDPDHPPARLRTILEDARPAVVIADADGAEECVPGGTPLISPTEAPAGSPAGSRPAGGAPPGVPRPSSLAYVIYTSGSTGAPKGVEVEHRALANLVLWHREAFGVGAGDRGSQVASPSFDASVWETWANLAAGAELVIAPPSVRRDPRAFRVWLDEEEVTVAFASTPVAETLLREEPGPARLRLLLTGGDRLRSRPTAGWPTSVVNCYGPTECAVVTTAGTVDANDDGRLPAIGQPIRGVRAFILDERGQPVPPGVPGELCVAGPGLARGYRDDANKTAAAFREARFPEAAGTRLYHTGDRVRFRSDGTLAFLGREDRQVKIRGQRIELGEVEAALMATDGIEQGVAEVRETAQGDRRLVAFVAGGEGAELDEDGLRSRLRQRLPGAMVPARIVILPEMPLSPSGKVDRDAIAGMTAPAPVGETPVGPTETTIAEVWQEVLGVTRVGRHDDFFAVGGHSLNAISVVIRLKAIFGTDVPLAAFFESATVADLATLVQAGSPAPASPPSPGASAVPGEADARREPEVPDGGVVGHFPLSPDQSRLWYLQQLDPESAAYHIPLAYRLKGRLDGAALQASLDELVRRHDALRTTVDGSGSEPVQVVHPPAPLRIHLTDLPPHAPDSEVRTALQQEATAPFDLERGPLVRVRWLRRGEEDHHLVVTLHHLIADGWSAGVMAREISRGYARALTSAVESSGPDAGGSATTRGPGDVHPGTAPTTGGLRWGPWCARQRAWLESRESDAELAFWRHRLADVPPLELPTDHLRPDRPSHRGRTHAFRLPVDRAEGLEARCRAAGVTPFAGLLAGFMALLHRYAGQTDLSVGTVVAGRTSVASEAMVGLFANTLVVRTEIDPEAQVDDLLQTVGRSTVEALEHQRVPFGGVVDAVGPPRDPSRNPLFQVAFLLQNQDPAALDLPEIEAEAVPVETGTAKFDLTLSAQRDDRGYALHLEYATDLFRAETIERMARHLGTLLSAMADGFAGPIARLPMVRNRAEWSLTGPEWTPSKEPVHVRVSEQARRTPDARALTGEEGESLTYRELDIRSHRVAVALAARGAKVGDVIAVGLPRTPDMVTALLGIMKAGAAYLPLDPDFPARRLDHVAADAGASLLVTTEELRGRFPSGPASVLLSELLGDAVPGAENEARPDAPDFPAVGPDHLAYLIYTSGSTGGPKGVEVTHGNAVNLLDSMAVRPGIEDGVRWLAVTTLSFDISVLEIFGPLLVGGEVVLASTDTAADGNALRALVERTRPTRMQATPSTWRMLLDAGWEGDGRIRALVGGEALPPELARTLAGPCAEVWNMYGPTETTVWSTCGRVDGSEGPIHVGTPVANTRVHILDEALQPVPRGVAGELYIGGNGVALGYHGRPELTAERFIPDPFAEKGGRMYRTGDRVHLLPDGTLEVLGRLDGQVKIRGFRIEAGEVEAALEAHPDVRSAVVKAFATGTPDARLVAFVVRDPDREVSGSEIRRFARQRLPRYMVPGMVSLLDELPLTPNGKVDRHALADPLESGRPEPSAAYRAPATEAQRIIAEVWSELLPGTRIGRGDNFFELGGHSLLSIRAVAEIRRRTGRELDPRAFFFQSVEQLAAGLEDGGPG